MEYKYKVGQRFKLSESYLIRHPSMYSDKAIFVITKLANHNGNPAYRADTALFLEHEIVPIEELKLESNSTVTISGSPKIGIPIADAKVGIYYRVVRYDVNPKLVGAIGLATCTGIVCINDGDAYKSSNILDNKNIWVEPVKNVTIHIEI